MIWKIGGMLSDVALGHIWGRFEISPVERENSMCFRDLENGGYAERCCPGPHFGVI